MKKRTTKIRIGRPVIMALVFCALVLALVATGSNLRIATAVQGPTPPPATLKTWAVGADPIILGFDPHETIPDLQGVTAHVATPEAPLTMVTSMENIKGNCGFMFWNPQTNVFKGYRHAGAIQVYVDVDPRAPAGSAPSPPGTFGGGDTWATIIFTPTSTPYVNFRGSDNFRQYNVGAVEGTGIRVHPLTGKVYFGNFDPGQIYELDPTTNTFRTWAIGNRPRHLVVFGDFVYFTAVAGGGQPDQIVRLDPETGELKRWNVPGGGFDPSLGVGTPNSITRDFEGNIWFTESASNELGRLTGGPDGEIGTGADVIEEFTKPGIMSPHAIASSGAGATLQAFFTEATGQAISLLTRAQATPISTTVTPITQTVTPTTGNAQFFDFPLTPFTATIPPQTFNQPGVDPDGIVRYPIPPGHANPTGMTPVVIEKTVFGSMEGSDHVFQLTSEAIVAPPGQPPLPPAAPTSKEQCMKGNYRQFGFRNQGQCIKAVNQGKKGKK